MDWAGDPSLPPLTHILSEIPRSRMEDSSVSHMKPDGVVLSTSRHKALIRSVVLVTTSRRKPPNAHLQ